MGRKKEISRTIDELRDRFEFLAEAGAGFIFREAETAGGPAAHVEANANANAGADSHVSDETADGIGEEVRQCRLCPLSQQRNKAVPGEGNPKAELMFVGEAPGRDEDSQGRPFVGRAGKLLRKIIDSMNFTEEEVFITNVVKCRPPDNRVPQKDEVGLCSPYLERQIVCIAPRVIVTLGKTPTEYFLGGTTRSMSDLRGHFFQYKGVQVMPTFHPSYLVRNEGNRELRKKVWDDMQQVMELLSRKKK